MGAAPSSGTSTSFEAAATPPASEVPAAPAPARGKLTEVTLRFNGDSWAEVYDAKGAKIFYDIGSADSVKTLSGAPPLRVILGNPTGVAMEINGKSMTVPTVKGDNGVQFTVFRNGRLSRGRAAPSAQ
jgi:cytoskeleton protein RodZ